ncbi:hypothetical protein IT575_03405 [bacterium]|nr:hypothetical protein [bacterium]
MLRESLLQNYYNSRGVPALARLRELEGLARLSPHEYRAAVQQRLGAALEYAARTVPFFSQQGRRTLEDYPVLSKQQIHLNFHQMQSSAADRRGSGVVSTSGSSGQALRVLHDREEQAWRLATGWYGECMPGRPGEAPIGLFDGTGYLWGASDLRSGGIHEIRKKLRYWLRREAVYPCYMLSSEKSAAYHADILLRQPARVMGYVNNLRSFAQFCRALDLPPLPARKVIPTAEQLDPFSAEQIQQAFDAPLRQRYGGRECGGIAAQCEQGNWHLFTCNLYPEVLLDDGSIAPHGSGQLLLTSLNKRLMPLIRYNIEDRVVLPPLDGPPCACGRPFPRLESLDGRVVDYIRFADGSTLHGLCVAEALRAMPKREFIFVQDEVDRARLLVVPFEEFEESHLQLALERLQNNWIGGRIQIEGHIVPELPLQLVDPFGNGKRLQCLNLWWRRQARGSAEAAPPPQPPAQAGLTSTAPSQASCSDSPA